MAEFAEMEDSPRWTLSGGKWKGVREFLVPWDDQFDFCAELYGKYEMEGGVYVPGAAASYPGLDNTHVTDVDCEPFGTGDSSLRELPLADLSSEANRYHLAKFTASYGHFPALTMGGASGVPTIPEGTFLTYDSNLGVEMQTIPSRKLEWVHNNKALEEPASWALRIPTEEMRLAFNHVPMIPTASRWTRGLVNHATFMGYPAECVMFMGTALAREFQFVLPPAVPELWKLVYMFSVRQILDGGTYKGWNTSYNPDGDGAGHYWLPIQTVGTHVKPFPTADFQNLFSLA